MPKYIKGLSKDTGHIDQIEGTYRYAINAVLNDRAGAIQNEHGTSQYVELPVNTVFLDGIDSTVTIIGTIEITDGRVVIFGVTEFNRSIIYLVESTSFDNYPLSTPRATIIFASTFGQAVENEVGQLIDVDLKLNKNFPIQGTYKINPNGDLIAYWSDNKNPPRALNITRQRSHVFIEDTQLPNSYVGIIYGKDPFTSPNLNYIDRLNLFPHAGPVPHIEFKEVKNGGALKTGTYYLFLAYVDEDATQTNYITSSLPVPIVEDIESVLPIERYDGAPADSQTGKMISWTVSNINTDYEFIRPTIVSRINNVENAYVLNDVETKDIEDTNTVNVSFSMLEGYASGSIDAVTIDAVAYDTAKTLTQLDSVLYLGNLSGTKDVGYQKYANFIKLSSVCDENWNDFDPFSLGSDNLDNGFFEEPPLTAVKTQGYRDLHNIINKRGYMRDEVYAFYIAFILNDGSMSYAYHIPGREAKTDVNKDSVKNLGTLAYSNMDALVDEKTSIDLDPDLYALSGESGKLFHFYDFSSPWVLGNFNMNYWENLNEFYPNTDDYTVYDGELDTGTDLRGTNVRHHHFPSNWNGERSVIDHDYTLTVPTVNDVQVCTSYYFTFTDVENSDDTGPGNDIVLTLSSGDDYSYFQDNTPYNNTDGLAAELGGYINSPGPYQGATFLAPTDVILANGNNGSFTLHWQDGNNNSASAALDFFNPDVSGDSATLICVTSPIIGDPTSALITGGNARGFVIWTECTQVSSTEGTITQAVRPLGFKLSDLKIPSAIAEKVQGFRIYYASRDHNNRRVLGQDHIKQSPLEIGKDIAACGSGLASSAKEDFIISPGSLYRRGNTITTGTFHDFYLLNGGYGLKSKGLSTATHVNTLHEFRFYSFKGPGHNYPDVPIAEAASSCQMPSSRSAFHIGHTSENKHFKHVHFPLREKCRTYVEGDSIYDGRSLGFGKRINNIGGEKNIALGFVPDRGPDQNYFLGAPNETWNEIGTPGTPAEVKETPMSASTVILPLYNLQAFKTDMYMSTDTQRLVWTGYEVLGDDINYFTDKDLAGASSAGRVPFETPTIYGGDTFICRHGYRMTHRPEFIGTPARDHKTVISTICESTDNINFRHEESNASACFPGAPLKRVLDLKADVNLTDTVNMKYNADYSLGTKDVKFPPALPLRDISPSVYPNRVQRSAKSDDISIIDNYRVFLSGEIKDLPRNRGSLWNLVSFNNLLYMHMEDSLFRTKGKQSMQMSDGSEAFLGSGNIFAQEPDEMVQTESGYGGTQSQWASVVTAEGYFCLDYQNRKVYLITDKINDIGRSGMATWFRDNIPFGLEPYGIEDFDNPIVGVGFHAVWDQKYSRILLTKRDIVPSQQFIEFFNAGTIRFNRVEGNYEIQLGTFWRKLDWIEGPYFHFTGWTISYSPASSSWVSFHDYIPYLYSYTNQDTLSMVDRITNPSLSSYEINLQKNSLHSHSTEAEVGNFYTVLYPFEFEFIYNKAKDEDKVFYSFNYIVDVYNDRANNLLHNQGFDKFFVYTTHQFSGEQPLEYMMNTRRTGNEWKVNKFRDLAALITNTDTYYIGPHTGSNYGVPGANVAGTVTTSVLTTQIDDIFNVTGMYETVNTSFINNSKSWDRKRKFTDKWVGIRLIYSNSTKNLIYLYATDVASKQFYR